MGTWLQSWFGWSKRQALDKDKRFITGPSSDTLGWYPAEVTAASQQVFTTDPDPDCAAADRGPIVGIDLGTSNSVVAVMRGGRVEVIPNQEGEFVTPSLVCFTEDGEVLVGSRARRRAVSDPTRTVYSIKRCLGRRPDEFDAAAACLPYQVVTSGGEALGVEVDDRQYTPAQIAAFILAKLRAAAEAYLGQAVRRAVLTVPACFNDDQRQATLDAALLAGFDVEWVLEDPVSHRRRRQPMRVINEPTAAALAHGLQWQGQKLAVFHMGGGTFDISVLDTGEGVLVVRAVGGDTALGGDDFDRALIAHFLDALPPGWRNGVRTDACSLQRLREAAEQAKKDLSVSSEVRVNLPCVVNSPSGPRALDVTITRVELERLVEPLIERCRALVQQVLGEAGYKASDIDEVLLVGGMTRMPRVRRLFQEIFGKEGHRGVNPDEGVAVGAAIQGAQLQLGGRSALLLVDVTPFMLSVEVNGGDFLTVVRRNTTIPVERKLVFTTLSDHQPGVSIRIFRSEDSVAAHQRFFGQLDLDGLAPAPKGQPRVEVTFDVDHNGILRVSATDLASGRRKTIRLARCAHPEARPPGAAPGEASRQAKGERSQRHLANARSRAGACAKQVEELLDAGGERVNAADRAAVRALREKLRLAAAGDDLNGLERTVGDLERAMEVLARYLKQRPAQDIRFSAAPGVRRSTDGAELDLDLEI